MRSSAVSIVYQKFKPYQLHSPLIMAGTQFSAVSFTVPCNQFASCRTKPLLSVSASTSISSPSKPTRRKNHLRIKILKTLTKPPPFAVTPVLPQLPLPDSAKQIVSTEVSGPAVVETDLSSPAECCPTTTADGESRLSESSNTASPFTFDVANFSWGSFMSFGAYLLALFAFQTICTVWVLGYGKSIKEDKNSDEGLSVGRKSRREVLLNGNEKLLHGDFGFKTSSLVYLEELKMREKIEEIRSMAREARKKEKYKRSDDFGDGDVISRARIGIEKEIDARLVKLEKRLNSAKEKISESHVNYLLKSEDVEDAVERNDLNDQKDNKSLIFKKRLKYRNPSGDRMKKPKGFQGFVPNGKKSGSNSKSTTMEDATLIGDNIEVKDPEKRVDREIRESVSEMSKDDGINLGSDELVLQPQSDRKNLDIGIKGLKNRPSNGVIQETSSVETSNSNPRDSGVKMSKSFTKGNQETSTTSAVSPLVSSKDSSVGKKSMAGEGSTSSKQSNKETDLWWLNLPYVLVIFMHRGSEDEEELEGLFTLKIPSKTQDLEESTYTVAFEDRGDANNFCYLLESFFEELGNFTADIVPLATKEIDKVVKSHWSNIIVVKKGHLQLYAGQPFADVEMALQALAEQNENVISLPPR